MTGQGKTYPIHQLRRRYLTLRIAELLIWSMAISLVICSILLLTGLSTVQLVSIFVVVFILSTLSGFYILKLHEADIKKLVRYLDQKFPELENSTDLLLADPHAINSIENLQREKIINIFQHISPGIKIPQRIPYALTVLVASVACLFVFSSFEPAKNKTKAARKLENSRQPVILPTNIKHLQIKIAPPAYTGISAYTTQDPNLVIPSGSKVTWDVTFTEHPVKSWITISNADSLLLKPSQPTLTASAKFETSAFYQIHWRSDADKSYASDYFKIEVQEDRPPEIKVEGLSQFTELSFEDKMQIPFSAILKDDYNLTQGYLIATVSKGSGESVKFREEKLSFSSPDIVRGKTVKASRIIDLKKLGLDPGDELYFYVVAIDNKTPDPNITRSETYFIALRDTVQYELSIDGGLGVDLMPEYFRSQRQIIIDTEKLLKEKHKITRAEFNSKSNELGYDQKVLRLRYGQFLGEEFESGIGPTGHSDHTSTDDEHDHDHDEEDVTKTFGHVHDHEDHDHHHPTPQPHTHDHHTSSTNDDATKNPLEEFIHRHDDPEEATFFTQSIRAKLKATLTIMWDAELYLRLFEPEKSLPYQYKALKLLKEISNDSRIYVHRTGFDPPPIKEEKRLSGDLSDLKHTSDQKQIIIEDGFVNIKKAVLLIEKQLDKKSLVFSSAEKTILSAAGNELSAVAIAQPGQFIETLSLIKKITSDDLPTENLPIALLKLKQSFYKVIPEKSSTPTKSMNTLFDLDNLFLINLN